MPLSVADALPRLYQVCVNGAVHPDYALTVQRAALYRKLATGDIESLLRQFTRQEDDFQFATRKQATIETVSASWNQLRTPFYEVARLRGSAIVSRLDYAEEIPATEADRRRARVTEAISKYYNRKPLDNYLAEKLSKSHMMSDPNAWLLTEFHPFDYRTQVAKPYPLLIACEAAVDFGRQAGETSYFVARLTVPGVPGAFRYCCYLATQAIDCWPVVYDGETPVYTMPEGGAVAGQDFVDGNGKVLYQYRILTHGASQVPAQVLGYVEDEAGTGETFISPLHPALQFLIGMLKVGSENDVVMSQMASPIRSMYGKDCPGAGRDADDNVHTCINGLDTFDMSRCSVCGGSGQQRAPITALQTMTVPYPKKDEDVPVKPADALAFLGPSAELPKLQLEYLQSRRLLAMQAVHGTEDADRVAGTETATQRRLRQEAQRVALSPFADQLASIYIGAASVSASYVDAAQGLTVVREIPVVEQVSEDELYDQRAAAQKAGADASTLEAIDARIAIKQFADDAAALTKNQVKRRFITFLGYTIEQVNQMYMLGGIRKNDWLARVNADIIFGELEIEKPEFYQLAYIAQAPLVQAKIDAIAAGLPSPTAALPRMNLSPTI